MLSNFLNRLMKTTNTDDKLEIHANLSKHEQAKRMLKRITTRKGKLFNPVKASIVQLECIDVNVIAFIVRLNNYVEKLKTDEGLNATDCFADLKVITLDRFFTDDEGMYIPASVVNSFIASSQELFETLDERMKENARTTEYSIRLMRKCFSSIHNVCKAMEETSQ